MSARCYMSLARVVIIVVCIASVFCADEAKCGSRDHGGMLPLGDFTVEFGMAVAVDQQLAVVGDPGARRAYMFDVDTGEPVSMLRPDTALETSSRFGQSVDIDGGLTIVSDPTDDSIVRNGGAVYVFETTTGKELFKLSPPRPNNMGMFGSYLAIDGNTAVVASLRDRYLDVFNLTDGSHVRAVRTGLRTYGNERPVALEGELAVIGGYHELPDGSETRVSVVNIETGEQVKMLSPPRSPSNERRYFGSSVAIDSGRIAVGERPILPDYNGSGAVDVFDLETGELEFEFTSDVPDTRDFFGSTVALSGDVLLVGANKDSSVEGRHGAVHLFNVSSGERLDKLTGLSGAFGTDIAAYGRHAIIGSPGDSAFIVQIPEPSTLVLGCAAFLCVLGVTPRIERL